MAASTSPNIASVTSLYGTTVGFALDTTVTTDLITVSANKILRITTLLVANIDGTNSADLNLYIDGLGSGASGVTTTGADATVYLAKTVSIPADSTLVILDTPIYLMEADVLKGVASSAGDLDLFISYEVFDDA